MSDTAKTKLQLRNLVRQKLLAWPSAVTTLNGSLTSTTTSVVVTSATDISERMLLCVESEIMRVQSVSGTTVTVIRGDRGSTAAAHSTLAVVTVYPYWGWTDSEINAELDMATRWLYPEVWMPIFYQNTLAAQAQEFGIPDGWSYPDRISIEKVELSDDQSPAQWREIAFWRQVGDRLIFDRIIDKARNIRLTGKGKQDVLVSDTDQLQHNDYAEAIVLHATYRCMECLLANRVRYVEYSATLNDRASTPDEIQRDIFYFQNQAILERDRVSRPGLPGFLSVRRGG